jgi:hypothetical protein
VGWNWLQKAEKVQKEIECSDVVSVYTTIVWEALIYRTLLGMYSMKLKSKKWYYRIFHHMLGYDVNTWLLDERM